MTNLIRTKVIDGEMAIDTGEGFVLVASKSEVGVWHKVTMSGGCDCKGFSYRSTCKHLQIAGKARATVTQVPTGAAVFDLMSVADD